MGPKSARTAEAWAGEQADTATSAATARGLEVNIWPAQDLLDKEEANTAADAHQQHDTESQT